MRSTTLILGAIVGVAFVAMSVGPAASAASRGGQDGNGKIVFGTLHAGEDEIWVMNADGTGRRNLTRHDGAKISDIDPRWSPDGRQIAFSSDPTGNKQIWVMNADGSMAHAVTSLLGENRFPSWTANGRAIVFQSFVAGNFEIYSVNADGSHVVDLTNDPGVDWSPAAAPRGHRIVFTSERDGNGHLYVLDRAGGLRKITNSPQYDYFAEWSPSGDEIVFVREDATGSNDIYVVRANGRRERRLTNTPDRIEYYPTFSPDGRRIAFTACQGFPTPTHPRCSTHVMNLDGTGEVDLAFPTSPTPFPFVDNFDDNVRDVDHWGLLHDGTGGFVNEVNGRVEFSLAPDAAPSSGQFPAISVRYDFHCLLKADFDAQVDYQLLDWPAANGVVVQFHAFYADGTTSRQSQPWGESYGAFIPPGFSNAVPTSDSSGTLRLVRSGATLTSYYRSGTTWVELISAPTNQGPAVLTIEAASYGTFAHQLVRVAFDNFRIAASDVDCSSWRPDWHPDFQPVAQERSGDDNADD